VLYKLNLPWHILGCRPAEVCIGQIACRLRGIHAIECVEKLTAKFQLTCVSKKLEIEGALDGHVRACKTGPEYTLRPRDRQDWKSLRRSSLPARLILTMTSLAKETIRVVLVVLLVKNDRARVSGSTPLIGNYLDHVRCQ